MLISGWGMTRDYCSGGSWEPILQELDMQILTEDQCESFSGKFRAYNETLNRCFTYEFNMTDDVIAHVLCAKHEEAGKKTCYGESGGPLMIEKDGRHVLVGVTSGEHGCGVVSFSLDPRMHD